MKRKTKAASRRRKIPVPAQITMHGSCDYFCAEDALAVQEIVRRPFLLGVTPDDFAQRLNVLSEDFLVRYAMEKAPTPDSTTSEWCVALARDVGGLLERLGSPDRQYPEMEMRLETRVVLTNVGTEPAISEHHYRVMRLGESAWDVLDKVPRALWVLKKTAEYAASQYGERATAGRSSLNRREPQHFYLIQAMAQFLYDAFDLPPPRTRPSHRGPFIKAVDYVRLGIVKGVELKGNFTDQGTDALAARRLRHFVPAAAASLWARQSKNLLKGLRIGQPVSMMERPKK